MKILTFTTLYPNDRQPQHAIFVENRLRHLISSGCVRAQVVAPVPWFPFHSKRFGHYAEFAKICWEEYRHNVKVYHPRYPLIPKISMNLHPILLYLSTVALIRRIIRSGYDFDLIDAHFFYPDGVAAVLLGRHFSKPVVITGRGTDLNLYPRYRLPRVMIRWAARNAAGLVTVCEALKNELADIGIEANRVKVLRNGVDLELFRPLEQKVAKNRLNLATPTLLSVGHLIPRKRHDLVIRSLSLLPRTSLMVAGEGPEEPKLRKLANKLELENRIKFLGAVPHEEMPKIYSAADALVLASDREGWPNVLLEAMACGTPVVASDVGGNPEVVTSQSGGLLFHDHTPEAIAMTVRDLLSDPPRRIETRAYAEGFGWNEIIEGQLKLFRKILDRSSDEKTSGNS